MARIDATELTIDPIGRPIPGQSLASDKADLPYERPPVTSSVSKTLESMLHAIEKPVQKENLMNLLEIGLSAETVASSLVMKAFTDGVITPDMAELLKPLIVIAISSIAEEEGVEYTLTNKPTEVSMNRKEVNELMKKVSLKDDTEEDIKMLTPDNTHILQRIASLSNEEEDEKYRDEEEYYDEDEEIPESTGGFIESDERNV